MCLLGSVVFEKIAQIIYLQKYTPLAPDFRCPNNVLPGIWGGGLQKTKPNLGWLKPRTSGVLSSHCQAVEKKAAGKKQAN